MTYSVMEGLVANPVRCIYQDSQGFIWIGTFEGLSRYDGHQFTNYTTSNGLSHNFINSLFEIDGKLLIAENDGSVDVISDGKIRKRLQLPGGVNAIKSYQSRILLGTDNAGFFEYKNDSIEHPIQEVTGSSLGGFVPVNDSLLLGIAVDNDIFIFDSSFNIYASSSNRGVHYYSVFRDAKQRLWACSSIGLKLLQLPAQKKQPLLEQPLPKEFDFSPVNNSQVTSMVEHNGEYWIGTSKGLVHIQTDGTYRVFEKNDGLPSDYVQCLFIDKEENLWIGTTLGLVKWVSKNSVHFFDDKYKGYKNDVTRIYPYNEKEYLVTTAHGIQYFTQETNKFENVAGLNNGASTIIEHTNSLLLHYPGYIAAFDEKSKSILVRVKLDSAIADFHSAKQHSTGLIFLAAGNGLYAIENASVKKILPHRVTAIDFDSSGYIYAGTWANGIFRLKRLANSMDFEIIDLTPIIQQKEIRSLYCASPQTIWIGTRFGGVFHLTKKTSGAFAVQQYNRQSGLFSDWIKCIIPTGTGDVWIGTYLGLDRLVKDDTSYRIFNFSKAVNFFAQVEQVVPAGANNWICVTNTGVARFRDEALHQSPPLHAYINLSFLGRSNVKLEGYDLKNLHHDQNALRFEFSAPGFINEKQVLYSYRLLGSGDTTWSLPANIHEAVYTSLGPGEYVFNVRTMGWNGQPGKTTSTAFNIQPPFWKTGWFYAFCTICIALLLYLLYRYRIGQLLKWQRARERIAADLHDDIGSSLTNISILSELGYKNLHQPGEAGKFLQRITEQIHDSSQAMDDIIWSVNSKNDSVQEILARMRRFAAELFDSTNIAYGLSLDENISRKKINMEQRRDVFLLYKGALNNIYKHAHATKLQITVCIRGNMLMLHVQDNGFGFDPAVVSHRNGLKNLYQRTAKWHGSIHIQSAPGEGTCIKISMPIIA